MNCKYCNKEFTNVKSGASHTKWCQSNPNRYIPFEHINVKGRKGWSKGLTKETDDRVRRNSESLKEGYKSGKLTPNHPLFQKGVSKTPEQRKRISDTMKRNPKAGGLRRGSGRGKKSWYVSPIAGRVFLDSTWELSYARWLDQNNIVWKRNQKKFPYEYNGQIKYYIPDFYLVESQLYIEIKGFERELDKFKWKSFPHQLLILKHKELIKLGIIK